MSTPAPEPFDLRRFLVLAIAIGLFIVWIVWHSASGTPQFLAEASGRISLMMAALWIAWPSLRKPAMWLPPGGAALCILVLGIIAARPRLVVVAIPALGVLLALATVVRVMKR